MKSWISDAYCLNQQVSSPSGVSCLTEGKVGKQSRITWKVKKKCCKQLQMEEEAITPTDAEGGISQPPGRLPEDSAGQESKCTWGWEASGWSPEWERPRPVLGAV